MTPRTVPAGPITERQRLETGKAEHRAALCVVTDIEVEPDDAVSGDTTVRVWLEVQL